MFRPVFLRVWSFAPSYGRCKYCGGRVRWAITQNGKSIPLAADAMPIRTERDPETHKTFDVFDRSAVHFGTCPKPPLRPAARSWGATR